MTGHLLMSPSEPSASPRNLTLVDTTSTSILVKWEEVRPEDKNGIIISYNVSYQAVGGISVNAAVNTMKVPASPMEANLTNLTRNQRYNIKVLASTIKGDGNYSIGINITTNQSSKSVHSYQSYRTCQTFSVVSFYTETLYSHFLAIFHRTHRILNLSVRCG